MIRLAFLIAILSAGCAASELSLSFLGGEAVSIERSEVLETRRLGSVMGRGGPITLVKLRGTSSTGAITLQAPRQGPVLRHLNPIKASCGRDGEKAGIGGLNSVMSSADSFRDYVGQAGLDASWEYWFAFTPSLCDPAAAEAMDQKTDAYFVCAGKPEKFRCVREHSSKQYSAFFFITSEQLTDWRKVDAEIEAYLDRAVKDPAAE